MAYITCRTFNKKGIDGELKISKRSSVAVTDDGFLTHKGKIICTITSQNAYDHFALNDDGKGMERYELSHSIINDLSAMHTKADEDFIALMNSLEGDDEASEEDVNACYAKYVEAINYIKSNHPNFIRQNGGWSFDFYNASISDLEDVSNRIKALG